MREDGSVIYVIHVGRYTEKKEEEKNVQQEVVIVDMIAIDLAVLPSMAGIEHLSPFPSSNPLSTPFPAE